MYLKTLSLLNFKNFESLDLEMCDKVNCFIGDNGTGKTNILDSIHYLSFCKSFINLNDRQNIKHGEDFFVVQGEFERENETEKIYCGLQKDKKKSFRRNNIEYPKLSEHIGLLPVVFTTPYDSNLIHLGSDIRRKFVDTIISQFDKQYLKNLIEYNKILEHRNTILRNVEKGIHIDADEIAIWDMQLADKGIKIYESRKAFTEEVIDIFRKYYNFISEDKENIELEYSSQLAKGNFETLLKQSFEKDKILNYTSTGIHKDDFTFLLDGNSLKRFGSQGQQKTFVISLKFAQFDYIKNKTGISPILLLDDIFDKLDKKRVTVITKLVSDADFGQIFISDTSYTRMPNILKELDIKYKILNLSNNQVLSNYE
ncbi:MAG: DNA replication and repair protein RecF [Bacteroidales bacterium]|jgi:DNA replication and repair protein RecF|nr:DNA replication and repair protein RecF [Bacteroidales bacterium]